MSRTARRRDPTAPLNVPARVGTTPPTGLPADVAATLRQARKRLGWSIRRAGHELGTAHTMVIRLEAGTRASSVAMAERIVEVYRLDWAAAHALLEHSRAGVGRSRPGRARTAPAPSWRAHDPPCAALRPARPSRPTRRAWSCLRAGGGLVTRGDPAL